MSHPFMNDPIQQYNIQRQHEMELIELAQREQQARTATAQGRRRLRRALGALLIALGSRLEQGSEPEPAVCSRWECEPAHHGRS